MTTPAVLPVPGAGTFITVAALGAVTATVAPAASGAPSADIAAAVGMAVAALACAAACGRAARASGSSLRRAWDLIALAAVTWGGVQVGLAWPVGVLAHLNAGLVGSEVTCAALFALAAGATGVTGPSPVQFVRRLLDACLIGACTGMVLWAVSPAIPAGQGTAETMLAACVVLAAGAAVGVAGIHITQSHLQSPQTAFLAVALCVFGVVAFTGHVSWIPTLLDVHLSLAYGCATLPLVLLAAATVATPPSDSATRPGTFTSPGIVPYAPIVVVATTLLASAPGQPGATVVTFLAVAVLLILVVARQALTARETHHLQQTLAYREVQLQGSTLTERDNRSRFIRLVQNHIDAPRTERVVVALVDIDNFQRLRDQLGDQLSSSAIVDIAERLMEATPGRLGAARIGDDEFALLVDPASDPGAVGQHLVSTIRRPFTLDGTTVHLTASVGIAAVSLEPNNATGDDMLQWADTAMCAVKRSGRDGYRVHADSATVGEHSDRALAPALEAAIADRTVGLAYMPIVAADSGRITSMEALARWDHQGAPIPPQVFVGVCERTGMMNRFTDLTIDLACQQLRAWNATGDDVRRVVAVNLGGYCLRDRSLVTRIFHYLDENRVEPGQLTLEITESVPISDIDAARDILIALKDRGVRLVLDDFGSGYNSISQLLRLPVSGFKLDRRVISRMEDDPASYRIAQGMFELGQHLDLNVVAEGVETTEQLALLRHLGVPLLQGYLIGRPAPAASWDEAFARGHLPLPASGQVPSQRAPKL